MSDIDEKIRSALSAEDKKEIEEMEDGAGLFELIGLTFKGKQAWMSYYLYFLGFVVAVAGAYFVMQYLDSTDVKTSLNWALLIISCFFFISLIKILGWQQIQKAEIMREIKRLEMRIILITAQNQK
jgi:hypothetical protein